MRDEFERAVEQFDLVIPDTPERGGYGDVSGGGTGRSLEYMDHRAYQPGDDVRRIDWKAYARTEEYIVKQYRDEVSPVIEVILDGSRSMAITDEKKQFVRDLVTFIARLGAKRNTGARVLFVGSTCRVIEQDWEERLRSCAFRGRKPLANQREQFRSRLHSGAVRFLITDGLFPVDPSSFLMEFARNSAKLHVIQTLAQQEQDPERMGGTRLVDVETGAEMDCLVSNETVNRYKKAVTDLCNAYEEAAQVLKGAYARLVTGEALMYQIRHQLVPAEILTASNQ